MWPWPGLFHRTIFLCDVMCIFLCDVIYRFSSFGLLGSSGHHLPHGKRDFDGRPVKDSSPSKSSSSSSVFFNPGSAF